MQTSQLIDISDGHRSRALIDVVDEQAPWVVLVHGLGGQPWEHAERRAHQDEFSDGWDDIAVVLGVAGYNTLRFRLYDWSDNVGRRWRDVTVNTWAADLDAAVAFCRTNNPGSKVAVVGHSYGALGILASPQKAFDAAVLCDPPGLSPERNAPENWILDDTDNVCHFKDDPEWRHPLNRLLAERELGVEALLPTLPARSTIVLATDTLWSDFKVAEYAESRGHHQLVVLDGANHPFRSHRVGLARAILHGLAGV